jgi:nucleoside phosphorylase
VTEWSPACPGYELWDQPERGYLYGPREEVELFDRLAERAWLAYPGTPDGKGQMAPRENVGDQWLTVVYHQLENHQGTYLLADGNEWVASRADDGSLHCLPAEPVPEDAPGEDVERWRVTALATDVFTASVVAIDTLLASADEPYAVSWQEMDAYQKSPAFQNANFLVDMIRLGEGRTFPIYRYWCRVVEGKEPSICPNADPPADPRDRAVLRHYLPAIERRFRDLHLVEDGQTIHWVGRQASLGSLCRCFVPSAQAEVAGAVPASTTHEDSMTTEPIPYTLGQLIFDLEGSERAYQDNLRVADTIEAEDGHNLFAYGFRHRAAALLFEPDPSRQPGIDRIQVLCDEEWGTGLKAENVRRLRGRVCSKLCIGIEQADAMTLNSIADAVGPKAPASQPIRPRSEAMSPIDPSEKLQAILQKADLSHQKKLEEERLSQEEQHRSQHFINVLNSVRYHTAKQLYESTDRQVEATESDADRFYPLWVDRFLDLGRELNANGLQYQLGELDACIQEGPGEEAGHYAVDLVRLACRQDREQLDRFLRAAGANPELHGVRPMLHKIADKLLEMRNRLWVDSLTEAARQRPQEGSNRLPELASGQFRQLREALDRANLPLQQAGEAAKGVDSAPETSFVQLVEQLVCIGEAIRDAGLDMGLTRLSSRNEIAQHAIELLRLGCEKDLAGLVQGLRHARQQGDAYETWLRYWLRKVVEGFLDVEQARKAIPESAERVGDTLHETGDGSPSTSDRETARVSLGLVIALKEEFSELFREIKGSCSVEIDGVTGNRFYRFERPGATAPYQCVAIWAGEMGPEKAILVTERLLEVCNPSTVANLGIAAGVDKDVRVGDVVVATQVDNYLHRTKAVPAGGGDEFALEWSGIVYPCSQDLIAAIRNFQFAHLDDYRLWRKRSSNRLKKFVPDEQRTQLLQRDLVRKQVEYVEGHVASGPIVGASSVFCDWLKQRDRAFLGLEMEAAGVLATLYARADLKRSLILRGISDYGDERKKELDEVKAGALRRYAMCNALHLLWLLLKVDALPR